MRGRSDEERKPQGYWVLMIALLKAERRKEE